MNDTIHFIIRKDKVSKKGESPIYIRITRNRKHTQASTGYWVKASQWDRQKEAVKLSHPNSAMLNYQLKKLHSTFIDRLIQLQEKDLTKAVKNIKDEVSGIDRSDFYAYAETIVTRYATKEQYGSRDKAKSIINNIKKYYKGKKLSFSTINIDFLEGYERYARVVIGNKPNTINKDMKFIRQVFLDAIRHDYVKYAQNPFNTYKLKHEKTTVEYLLENEIQQLIELDLADNETLSKHRDMFVFACYACGLRVSDVLKLKWKNVVNDRLNLTIHKTNTQIGLAMPAIAIEILNKYKCEGVNSEDYVFGMLPNGMDETDLYNLDKIISSKTAILNKSLKVLAQKAVIPKRLTFHVSRHSFATNALRRRIPLEQVQKFLGHANIRETQIYAKIVDQDLDDSIKLFNN